MLLKIYGYFFLNFTNREICKKLTQIKQLLFGIWKKITFCIKIFMQIKETNCQFNKTWLMKFPDFGYFIIIFPGFSKDFRLAGLVNILQINFYFMESRQSLFVLA